MTTDDSSVTLFASDLDGTLIGNPEFTRRFWTAWQSMNAGQRPLLVYNTGRSVMNTRQLVQDGVLPEADVIIGCVGTELYDSRDPRASADFQAVFGGGWNISTVDELVSQTPGVTRQRRDALHPFQSSWHWPSARTGDVEKLRAGLSAAGIKATVIYSCEKYLDVLPECADKGKALAWLCRRKGIDLGQVVVAGDTGNDSAMFLLPGVKRIVPDNALPELLVAVLELPKYVSRRVFAEGVLDGLQHFGVLAAMPPLSLTSQRSTSHRVA
jgi:sucrose-6F-phosphate phosphohydrolase